MFLTVSSWHSTMALKSKYPDVFIPDNVSWPQHVYQHFDKYGDKTAIVSEPFAFSAFLFTDHWPQLTRTRSLARSSFWTEIWTKLTQGNLVNSDKQGEQKSSTKDRHLVEGFSQMSENSFRWYRRIISKSLNWTDIILMWSLYEIIHIWTAVVHRWKWRMIIAVNFPI